MIGVGVVSLICNIRDGSEACLVDPCKTVAERLCRRSVESKTDSRVSLPLIAGAAKTVHNTHCKVKALFRGLAFAGHKLGQLIQANVAK